ncbi:MAG: L,D-transpeptidase family protein [Lentisphaeria bacterium]|nr:L,D-transpeptidase family protein [Lentisphaeria bacterium]
MDFDDLYQNGRKRDLSNGKKLRFCCIFLVVAVITGLIVWKIIPRSPENVSLKKSGPQTETAVPADPVAVSPDTAGVPKTLSPGGEQKKDLPQQKPSSRAVGVKKPVPVQTGQGGELVKGIPGKGDVPSGADKPLVPEEKNKSADIPGRIAELEQFFQQNNFAETSRRGSILLKTLTMGSEQYRKVVALLTQANWQRFLNRDTGDDFAVRHTVRSGDQLGVIARKNKTTVAALMKANKIKRADLIQIGQKLTVLRGNWQIVVSKSCRLLVLKRNKDIFAGFDIGIGRAGKTPVDDFVITERLKHPVYRTSDGRIFKHGEKENQLGDYFLKLVSVSKKQRARQGFGIHGTPDETTVTRSLSNGCIRMRNADVEKLYYLVPSGTQVYIGE